MTVKPANFFFYSMVDVLGVVAANNFLSIFNPVSSTKALVFFSFSANSYAVTTSQVIGSMQVHRTTAASGGTLVAESDISRFNTLTSPASVAQVRINNPTTTNTGSPLIGVPPVVSSGSGAFAASTSAPPGAGFVVLPGQGITTHTQQGDVDQVWDLQYIWAEF